MVPSFSAAISLTVSASDATEAGVTGNGTITTPTALVFNGSGTGIAFDSGNSMRFGRLAIKNANGSQLVPLRVPLETQYWNGNAFVTNVADSCTRLDGVNIEMANYQGTGFAPAPSCKTRLPSTPVTFAAAPVICSIS